MMGREPLAASSAPPTLLTLGNLTCGFLATLSSVGVGAWSGGVREACCWLAAAALLDGLDGLVARRLDAESRFGACLDSLADVVSFGVAPAALAAMQPGMPAAVRAGLGAGYAACVAVRLARYVAAWTPERGPADFRGLPSPAAAAAVAAATLAGARGVGLLAVLVLAGLLMLSPVRFAHPATLARNARRRPVKKADNEGPRSA